MPVPFEALIPLGIITVMFGASGGLFNMLKTSVNEGQPPRYGLDRWDRAMMERDFRLTGTKRGQSHEAQAPEAFSTTGGFVIIESGHVKAKVDVNIVLKSSAAESDFTQVQANLAGKATTNSPGSNCIGVDLKAQLGVKDGQNATIQVRYDGGDSILYQCADVVLKMNPTNWNSTMCNLGHGTQPGTNQATTAIHKSAGTVVVCTVAALFGVLFS
ncbi:hypothetical protein BGW41_004222 [Actinomortierella wolfii]|nr:hypothetical protein BGW41_004222 [Actinomortierella wolfii]